jgi:hypothetical protein
MGKHAAGPIYCEVRDLTARHYDGRHRWARIAELVHLTLAATAPPPSDDEQEAAPDV